MNLEHEVDENRRSIRSDGYQMSIGEVANLYRDGEIIIRPEFQRLFRWTIEQQSRLVESILLDIPLPTIFVAQREDGVWEVVDGLQRLSTILQFMGELRDAGTGELHEPSQLVKTKYLPSLEGATYSGPNPIPASLRIGFKRARLDFRILLKESDEAVKYEVFDRLNSGGTPTSPQEVRTAQLLMANPEFYGWLDSLRKFESFEECVPLTERQLAEQYDLELVVRFLVFRNSTESELRSFADVDGFLTDKILGFAVNRDFPMTSEEVSFKDLFRVLNTVGPEIFRRFDRVRGKASGAFSVSAFEGITLGVAAHINDWLALEAGKRDEELRKRIPLLWLDTDFTRNSGAGVRATQRISRMGAIGARIFAL
ncbi:DUF262 domain-containing protein [Dactylosporangium sucinum]|uniref:GmrSD restriction endonucleases N-terminal domain-containing protein n=1 Tax=Dactylosporangium sucinum TaxID=1424081 RepID=A0A917TYH7_9ACTN|nr:DUF262 domain-containing protein [Dactylosporangium sucinum]GGM43994.1 hypothetical protein GCM10007977_051980 [Dactylosporangium sucinum]